MLLQRKGHAQVAGDASQFSIATLSCHTQQSQHLYVNVESIPTWLRYLHGRKFMTGFRKRAGACILGGQWHVYFIFFGGGHVFSSPL